MRDAGMPVPSAETAQDIARRKHRTAMRCMWASCFALGVSFAAVAATTRPEWAQLVPYLMWNHVLIIGLAGAGGWAAKRLPRRASGRAVPRPRQLLAPWMLALGVLTAVAALAPWAPSPWDLGTTPEGQPVTSLQMRVSEDGRRFYETLNRGEEREITQDEHRRNDQRVFGGFARIWCLFSFGAVALWRFVALRWQAEMEAPDEPLRVAEPAAAARPAGWKSSAAIAGLWALGIFGSLRGLGSPSAQMMCAGTVGGMDLPWFVLLFLPVMATVSAFFMKRGPFDAPWIAALVDERAGAGSYESFFVRLKPMLLIAVSALTQVLALAVQCRAAGTGPLLPPAAGFMLSASLAFALAHGVLRWRRIPGV